MSCVMNSDRRACSTARRSLAASQGQEWNDAFFKFESWELQDFFVFDGVGDVVFAGDFAAQGGEVSAAAEFLADLVGDAADVGAFGARNAEPGERFVVARKLEAIDVD